MIVCINHHFRAFKRIFTHIWITHWNYRMWMSPIEFYSRKSISIPMYWHNYKTIPKMKATMKYRAKRVANSNQVRSFNIKCSILVSCFNKVWFFYSILESPIEEVTDALYGKWRNFMMTHNLDLKMPEILFDGATFRITPRAFEGDGALIKLEMIPRDLQESDSDSGRLFGLKKHISKFLKSKCTQSHTSRPWSTGPLVMLLKHSIVHMHKHNGHLFWDLEHSWMVINSLIYLQCRKIPQK